MKEFLKKYFSRKFIYAVSVFITSTYMLYAQKIDGWQWLTAITLVGSVYSLVNYKEKKVKNEKNKGGLC